MRKIHYIEAPCGTGKTQNLIKKVNASSDQFLIAVSTIKNGESLTKGIADSVFISRGTSSAKVFQQVEHAASCQRVIIITHSGLATLTPILYRLEDYHLIVDELTDNLLKTEHLKISKDDGQHLQPYLTRNKGSSKGGVGFVRKLMLSSPFTKRVSTLSVELNNILLLAQDGYPVIGVSDLNNQKSVKDIWSIRVNNDYLKILDAFKSVTALSATINGTLNQILLEAMGYEFEVSNWSLNASHKPFIGEVYVFQGKNKISSKLLNRETIKQSSVRSVIRDKVDQELGCEHTAVWFANKKAIDEVDDCLNEFVCEGDDFSSVVSLEQKGSNEYLDVDNAVCLFSVNPTPVLTYLLGLLERHLKLSEGVLVQAWSVSKYLEQVYQNCLRTSYRVLSKDTHNKFFIPDMRAYDYLDSKIPSLPNPIILFPDGFETEDKRKGNSGRLKSYTDADENRFEELKAKDYSYQKIADDTGVSKSAVQRYFKSMK
jgi:AraC-like DNA-binding protein